MQRSRKSAVIKALTALSVVTLLLIGGGCSQLEENEDSQTVAAGTEVEESDDAQMQVPSGDGQLQMPFGEIAEILGIEEQEIEDAFSQAQSEIGMEMGEPIQPEGMVAGESPPEGMEPGEFQPDEIGSSEPPSGGMFMPQDLLARVADILGIEEQDIEDAFSQVRGDAR